MYMLNKIKKLNYVKYIFKIRLKKTHNDFH